LIFYVFPYEKCNLSKIFYSFKMIFLKENIFLEGNVPILKIIF
jgi:hypothetical protein